MKISILGYVSIWGMTFVEAGLSLLLAYRFLWPMRVYFGVMAALDLEFFFVSQRADFHLIYWYSQIAVLLLLSFVVSRLLFLLAPGFVPAIEGILPTVVTASAFVAGKPGTVWFGEYRGTHMILYQSACLIMFLVLIVMGIIRSKEKRFKQIAIGFAAMLLSQVLALLSRLYMGLNPLLFNLCWAVGVCFIVHALFTYEPPGIAQSGKSPAA